MSWHVLFDGRPEVIGHICDLHRAIGQLVPCDDSRPDGDCAHVQTERCTCNTEVECAGCLEDYPE